MKRKPIKKANRPRATEVKLAPEVTPKYSGVVCEVCGAIVGQIHVPGLRDLCTTHGAKLATRLLPLQDKIVEEMKAEYQKKELEQFESETHH